MWLWKGCHLGQILEDWRGSRRWTAQTLRDVQVDRGLERLSAQVVWDEETPLLLLFSEHRAQSLAQCGSSIWLVKVVAGKGGCEWSEPGGQAEEADSGPRK